MKSSGLVLEVVLLGIASRVYANVIGGGSASTISNQVDLGFQLTTRRQTSGNSLKNVKGGSVFDGVGMVGELYGSDNNTVLVSDFGSLWTNNSLRGSHE
ncbi:hypothetical protein P4B35_17205 [Pontiellaceae bacterium B12227]|nr:hypothetical protein [Pontiellaceae bacterium B12227]